MIIKILNLPASNVFPPIKARSASTISANKIDILPVVGVVTDPSKSRSFQDGLPDGDDVLLNPNLASHK